MAEAFLNHLAKGRFIASSAGIKPASRVDPPVVRVMLEAGIDIGDRKPKLLTFEMIEAASRVVTMGCGAEGVCPASFVPTEDWELTDPKGKPVAQVRQIRDEIKARVEKLIEEFS
jgi:arsenate reductase